MKRVAFQDSEGVGIWETEVGRIPVAGDYVVSVEYDAIATRTVFRLVRRVVLVADRRNDGVKAVVTLGPALLSLPPLL